MDPCVIWFTGLSGSGKSTLAEVLFRNLTKQGVKVEHLDGDEIRSIVKGTGFSSEERSRHVQWVGYCASKLEKNGVVVIASFISPYRRDRDLVRGLCKRFYEIYVSTPLAECEQRDVKGLYARARRGELNNFTGISDPYEPPTNPDLAVGTVNQSVEQSLQQILQLWS